MIKKFFFIFICLIFIYYKKIYNTHHKFWDNQPVSRKYLKNEGIISKNPKFNIILKNNMFFRNININSKYDLSLIHQFINNHFSNSYEYSIDFLKESLFYLDENTSNNIGLFNHNNEIIGFIHCKLIKLNIKDKIQNFYYTDFLCVHKNYRNKNLATLLISKIITYYNQYQPFIFKKDVKNLPFNYINKTSYYYKNIDYNKYYKIENKIQFLNEENILQVFNFITNVLKKKKIYQIFSIEEFKKLYINTTKNCIIEYDYNDQIISVIIFITINFVQNKNTIKTFDIEHIFIDTLGYNFEIFNFLIDYAKKKNIKMITLIDQMYNKYFIDQYNMLKSMNIYFHSYNYHLNEIIDNFYMAFNFL